MESDVPYNHDGRNWKNVFDRDFYQNEDFSGISLADEIIEKIRFADCNFSGADLSDTRITGCRFEKCRFSGAKLNGAEIQKSAFLTCDFRLARLFSTVFEQCKMTGSSFFDADCSCFEIRGGDWSYTVLRELEMYKMTLEQVNLEGADLTGCKLEKSRFRQCCFDRAWMTGASLEGSDIRDSSIDGVDILGMSLKNTKIDLNQAVALAAALGAVYEP